MLSQEIKKIHDEAGIVEITIDDEKYPQSFRNLDNPPEVIYARGDVSLLNDQKYTAIIGSRNASMKAMDVAIGLANMLVQEGEIIIGGLAAGCDTGGHLGSIGAGGKTIAILPSPITQILPSHNAGLADKIVESGGLVISEYPHGSGDEDFGGSSDKLLDFRRTERDRLQAALSDGLIVVESSIDGGEMNTVNFALKMGKTVGAYRHPGGFDMTMPSEGNEMLIMDKAAMQIRNIKDVKAFKDELARMRAR